MQIYRDRRNVPRNFAEKAVMALYLPSAFGRVGKRGKPSKAKEIYEDFVIIYQDSNSYPEHFVKTWRCTDKMIDRKERLTGIKRNYHLRVVLFTQARKQDPDRPPLKQDKAVARTIQQRSRKYDRA